jgi:hypothetical protein
MKRSTLITRPPGSGRRGDKAEGRASDSIPPLHGADSGGLGFRRILFQIPYRPRLSSLSAPIDHQTPLQLHLLPFKAPAPPLPIPTLSCSRKSTLIETRRQPHYGDTRGGRRGPSWAGSSHSSSRQCSIDPPEGGYFRIDRTSDRHCDPAYCRAKHILQCRRHPAPRSSPTPRNFSRTDPAPASESHHTTLPTTSLSWLPSLRMRRCC